MKIKKIKNFHPSGKDEPTSGSFYHKGGYWREVHINMNSFTNDSKKYSLIEKNFSLNEAIHDEQYGLYDYRGGMIIFSTDVNSVDVSNSKIKNWFSKKIITTKNRFFVKKKLSDLVHKFNRFTNKKLGDKKVEDFIGAFSIGNFFKGRYVGDNGNIYNEKSISIEIGGISSEGLIFFAEEIAREFHQETVLVKDFNQNKVFLVNREYGNDYNYSLDKLNKKSK